jgi:hypothetical protein
MLVEETDWQRRLGKLLSATLYTKKHLVDTGWYMRRVTILSPSDAIQGDKLLHKSAHYCSDMRILVLLWKRGTAACTMSGVLTSTKMVYWLATRSDHSPP